MKRPSQRAFSFPAAARYNKCYGKKCLFAFRYYRRLPPELLSGLDLRSFYNMHQYGAPLDSVFLDMQVRNESNSIPVILRITSAIKIIQKGRFTAPFML